MKMHEYEIYQRYFGANNLNIGSSVHVDLPGNGFHWTTLDFNADVKPDVVHDLQKLPLPFEDNTYDSVFASHVLEHIDKSLFIPVLSEIWRILKPGGHLIAVTPHGSSDVALGMAQHKQAFYECTWNTVRAQVYRVEGNHGYMDTEGLPFRDWEFVLCLLVPWPEFMDDPELESKARHGRNYINEMHAVMKAVK